MDYKKLGDTPIGEVLERVEGLSAVGAKHQMQSIMAVPAKCTLDLLRGLETFTQNTHAQTTFIGETIRKFNKSLEDSIISFSNTLKESIQQFDASSSKISNSLAKATWALVFVTFALVIITGYQAYLTNRNMGSLTPKTSETLPSK